MPMIRSAPAASHGINETRLRQRAASFRARRCCLARSQPGATARQKVISEIMSGVERVRVNTERNMLDVLGKVHDISVSDVDSTHVFALS